MSSATRVFGLPELVARILRFVVRSNAVPPNKRVFSLQRVNKTFQNATKHDLQLQRCMWLKSLPDVPDSQLDMPHDPRERVKKIMKIMDVFCSAPGGRSIDVRAEDSTTSVYITISTQGESTIASDHFGRFVDKYLDEDTIDGPIARVRPSWYDMKLSFVERPVYLNINGEEKTFGAAEARFEMLVTTWLAVLEQDIKIHHSKWLKDRNGRYA